MAAWVARVMTEFTKQSIRELDDIRSRSRQLIEDLTPEQLTKRPDSAKWSIAECIVHLNMVAASNLPVISTAIEKARRENRVGEGPFNQGVLGRFLIKSMEPPAKRRFKAPKQIANPIPIGDASRLLTDFLSAQDELQKLLQQSDGLNLQKIKIQSPYARWMRTRLCATFPFILAHERRHLWQAENVKEVLGLAQRSPATQ